MCAYRKVRIHCGQNILIIHTDHSAACEQKKQIILSPPAAYLPQPRPTDDPPPPPVPAVVALFALQRVVADAAVQAFFTHAAQHQVGIVATGKHVIACLTPQSIGTCVTVNNVGAFIANHLIIAKTAKPTSLRRSLLPSAPPIRS